MFLYIFFFKNRACFNEPELNVKSDFMSRSRLVRHGLSTYLYPHCSILDSFRAQSPAHSSMIDGMFI